MAQTLKVLCLIAIRRWFPHERIAFPKDEDEKAVGLYEFREQIRDINRQIDRDVCRLQRALPTISPEGALSLLYSQMLTRRSHSYF